MQSYQGKNIWIIGASSGIGRALAIELASQGAILALSARSEDKLNTLKQQLGPQHQVMPLDIVNAEAFRNTAESLNQKLSHIDSIIFMAAVYEPAPLAEIDLQKAHQMVEINLQGAINTIYAVLPILTQQQSGQLVLCGSVAGYRGLPNGQPYSATKAAIINLAESLRSEHPELDIKLINPGFVKTTMTDKNEFEMPMMIEAEQAAVAIAEGLKSKQFEIHFPKKFTYIMKLMQLLPAALYFYLAKKLGKRFVQKNKN